MKQLILIFILINCIGCKPDLSGKVEFLKDDLSCYGRPSNIDELISKEEFKEKKESSLSAYLVNTSTEKIYSFTVLEESYIGDSLISKVTKEVTLSPGAEEWIGCTEFKTAENHLIKNIFSCVGQVLIHPR